jgi:serine phosphatase RsbU (regulator of sigma subunit)/anti-sigma regulatory factor (Ser/Thr protein kinase)
VTGLRFDLRLRMLAIGCLGILMALVIAQSALAGLEQVHRSDRAVNLISLAQREHQDADMMHDALRADVYNALLVGRGVRSESGTEVLAELHEHMATMRADLEGIARLHLSEPVAGSLARLRTSLEAYMAAADQLARGALQKTVPAQQALQSFERSFHVLVQAQAKVTAQVATAAQRTKQAADAATVAAQRRILFASLIALVGLLALTVTLNRMGKSLARLLSEQRGVAETLQQSLLPDRLPDLPGLDLAARYLAGGVGADVGGDWYDVIPLPTGEVGLVLGDVVGHDLHAASVMGQVRNALRAYALEGLSPAAALDRLNNFVRQIDPGEMATCVFAVYHPEAQTLLVSNAGHYPPLLVTPDRETVLLETQACPPIGGTEHVAYSERLYHVLPGSTVLLYTDGLIERRAEDVGAGLDQLRRVVAAAPEDVDALCAHVLAEFFTTESPTDDVALLALHTPAAVMPSLRLTLPAVADQLAPLRRTLGRWLDEARATPEEAFELTVACCEAASNAIEHAYSPDRATFDVTAVRADRDIEIRVTDRGRWRPPRGADRGRGLQVIRDFTDTMSVDCEEGGTTVRMRRRLAAVPAEQLWHGMV